MGWNAAGESRGSTAQALRGLRNSGEAAPLLERCTCERTLQAAQSEVMSGLFSYSTTEKDCVPFV